MTTAQRITRYSRDRLVFDVVDTGPIDGTPVVMLHGFPQRASSWTKVATMLHGHAFDGSRAERELGLSYTPAAETFRRMVGWYREQGLL